MIYTTVPSPIKGIKNWPKKCIHGSKKHKQKVQLPEQKQTQPWSTPAMKKYDTTLHV